MIETNVPLRLLPGRLAVCRLPAEAPNPDWAQSGILLAMVWTPDELSVVCEERLVPPEIKAERGWRAFQAQGPLDFGLVGILAQITGSLSQAGVPVFALSTFDTDYILIKEALLDRALDALIQSGHQVLESG